MRFTTIIGILLIIAGTAAGPAKLAFYLFLILFLVSAVVSALRGRPPPSEVAARGGVYRLEGSDLVSHG